MADIDPAVIARLMLPPGVDLDEQASTLLRETGIEIGRLAERRTADMSILIVSVHEESSVLAHAARVLATVLADMPGTPVLAVSPQPERSLRIDVEAMLDALDLAPVVPLHAEPDLRSLASGLRKPTGLAGAVASSFGRGKPYDHRTKNGAPRSYRGRRR